MSRTLIASFVVLLASLQLTTPADAQTCDPYRPRIDVDYRTYPTPETSATFWATVDQGSPVAGQAPYVWRYDGSGWHMSCASTSPEPPEATPEQLILAVGHYYETAYTSIFVVIGRASLSWPAEIPGDYFVIRYLSGPDGCGTVLRRADRAHRGVFREIAPTEPSALCRSTLTIEQ